MGRHYVRAAASVNGAARVQPCLSLPGYLLPGSLLPSASLWLHVFGCMSLVACLAREHSKVCLLAVWVPVGAVGTPGNQDGVAGLWIPQSWSTTICVRRCTHTVQSCHVPTRLC